MGSFDAGQYYRVFIPSLRIGKVVPFHTHILLRANNRIINFVAAGEVFSQAKADKLAKFNFNDVYLHVDQLPLYHEYLKAFLETPEGKQAIEDLKNNPDVATIIDAIPPEVAQQAGIDLTPLPTGKDLVPPTAEELGETVGSVTVLQEPEAEAAEEKSLGNRDEIKTENQMVKGDGERLEDHHERVEGKADNPDTSVTQVAGNLNNAEDEESLRLDRVIDRLRSSIDELDQDVHAKGSISQDDEVIIADATRNIESDLQKVRGLKEEDEQDFQRISGFASHISDELERIRGVADKGDDEKHRAISQYVKKVEEEIFVKMSGDATDDKSKRRIQKHIFEAGDGDKSKRDLVNRELWHIRQLSHASGDQAVDEAVKKIVEEVSQLTGRKIQIASSEAIEDRTPELGEKHQSLFKEILQLCRRFHKFLTDGHPEDISKRHKPVLDKIEEFHKILFVSGGEGELAESPSVETPGEDATKKLEVSDEEKEKDLQMRELLAANPEMEKHLGDVVVSQNRTITSLKARLKIVSGMFKGVQSKWETLQVKAKKALSQDDQRSVEAFGLDMKQMENACFGADESSKLLVSFSDRLSDLVGLAKENRVDGSNHLVSQNVDSIVGEPGADASAGGTGNSKESDEDSYEKAVLLSQLENAKSLLESNDKKIKEISNLLNSNAGYIEGIEKELQELRNAKTVLRDKLDEVEGKEDRMAQVMNDMDRSAKTDRAHSKEQKEMMFNYRDRIQALENHLKVYKEIFGDVDVSKKEALDKDRLGALPADVVAMIELKDQEINKQQVRLEEKSEKIKELQKEIIKFESKVQSSREMEVKNARKLEKMDMDKQISRKAEQAMQNKVVAVTNLLDEARKSVNKLTAVNEELRRDRMEYMSQTNKAMADFKAMTSKANSLNSHVEAEIQRNRKMSDQFEAMKTKNRELATKATEAQKQALALDAEVKRLKKQVGGNVNVPSSENPKVLEMRLNKLNSEHEKLKNQLKKEQRNTGDLKKKIKELQNQIFNKPAA